MQHICVLAALVALAVGHQPSPAEWMPGVVSRRAAGPAPDSLPPRDPDAEVIGPITDPRPALDGNFQVPRGHRLAGVYRNDKPRLPEDYVRYLQQQGLTPEQIEHGAGLEGTRRVRAPPAAVQMPLPGGLTLHLEPEDSSAERQQQQAQEQPPPRPPLPTDLYPEMQTVPAPSIEHLRSRLPSAASAGAPAAPADADATRYNEVGVSAVAGGVPSGWADSPHMEEMRRRHREFKQRADEQWKRALQRHEEMARGVSSSVGTGNVGTSGSVPSGNGVREEYRVQQLPGGGRSVSYSKRTTHHSSYSSAGGTPSLRLQRRKRQHVQHQPVVRHSRRWYRW